MKFLTPKTAKRITKNLTVFAVLLLSIATIFLAPQIFSATPTQDCSVVSGTAIPGDNCLYFYPLPLCKTIPSATYSIPATSILAAGTIPNHRVNCADLVDLPLCNQLTDNFVTAYPLKNCVKECSDPSFADADLAHVRGADYAVHNRDCIRFCDAPEAGVTANPGVNCVSRNCHQVTYVGTPTSGNVVPNPPTNCNLLPCNLLTPNELNEAKFSDVNTKNYHYCDTSKKCLEFTQAQLPYIVPTKTCQPHNCRVSCVPSDTDDVSIILSKGSGYVSDYQRLINYGYEVGSQSDTRCVAQSCKPIIQVSYRCTPQADSNPVIPNALCDTTGAGNACSSGYCYKTIDCNLAVNASNQNCVTGGSDGVTIGSTDDSSIDSWFYRPKPVDTALNSNGTIKDFHTNTDFTSGSVGYYVSQMRGYDWGSQAKIPFGLLGTWDLGYMHSTVFGDGIRSPGMADVPKLAARGLGYGYLCSTHGNVYNEPRTNTAYHSGYVETTFSSNDATHRLSVCLRFTNTLAFDHSCGERECSVTCAFASDDGKGCTQLCGYDRCVTLTIKDSDPFECAMSGALSTGGDTSIISGPNDAGKDCMKLYDGYMRLRAVKYGDYICTFLDLKGTLAYDPDYFDGSEKLSDGTCITGTAKNGSCTGGKNTNDAPGEDDKWRTVMRIPYIESTQAGGQPQGYLDKSGSLFPAQECIKTPHRITVPPLYNLANINNSFRIFIPPLYVLSSSTKRGGSLSSVPVSQTLGDTDFHYPEITVSFGAATQKLSLGFGKTGYEEAAAADAQGSATITTPSGYSAEVFVRKEFNAVTERPAFCLYQRIKGENGTYLNPQKIECVNRNYPEINNSATKTIFPSVDFRKMVISSDATNTYNSSKIAIQYLGSPTNNANCNSTGTSCSTALSLTNTDPTIETCDSSVENHKVCVQREECTKLNIECIQNEIDFHNAEITNQETGSFITIRNQCNLTLLPLCNAKFGIISSATATITNQNPDGGGIANAYGWFNELCVTQGFQTKLKRVIAYRVDGGIRGKCIIASGSTGDCSAGGKSPNCPCLEYISGMSLAAGQIDRNETPHEAGFCINMPLPQLCPAINHNPTSNPNDPNDPNYVATSLNQATYGTSISQINSVVHISHQYRTYGSASPNIPLAGHAEFPQTIFGFNDARGVCVGFWKQATNPSGNEVPPTASCLNSGGNAAWGAVTNACIRYSCEAKTTSGIQSNGSYQGNYGVSEMGEAKGLSNGYATWSAITSADFPVSATAASCIIGFKKTSATATLSGSETNADHAALYSRITGYTGGTLPTRQCNQLGQWQATTNNCQRISCSAINPPNPSGSGDTTSWELWTNSAGATYPAVNAARSASLTDGSAVKLAATSTGTCNNTLGFFQIVGGAAPTRVCDYLGNWGPVQNACITQCDAITDSAVASNTSNGYAYWHQAVNVPISGELATTTNGCSAASNPQFVESSVCKTSGFKSCVSGRILSPYPALNNKYGAAYVLTDSAANYITTIPNDVTADTRTPVYPERVCKSVVVVGGSANVWTATSSSCVNTCPSSTDDPRINAGKTKHPASSNVSARVGGKVTIDWPSASFGSWAYVNSPYDITTQNGSQYFYGRTNGYYSLARYCNETTHKWDAPITQCVTNNGSIKIGPSNSSTNALATYGPATLGRVAVGSQTVAGTCTAGAYSNTAESTVAAAVTCSYKNATNNIDETYFDTGSVAKCTAMCRSKGGETFGNSINPSLDTVNYVYYPAGTTLNLNCKSGFGSTVLTGTSQASPFADCGRSPNDRSANRPYVMCNDDGNGTSSWSTTVYNDCTACRNCSGDAAANGYTLYWSKYNHYEYGAEDYHCTTIVSCATNCAGSVNHNQTATCSHSDSCTTRKASNRKDKTFNSSASCTVSCFDGKSKFTAASCSGDC